MAIDNDALMQKLTELHGDFREFRGEMKIRVSAIEDDAKEAKKWENIKLFTILPVVAGLHGIATKIGILKH